MSSSNVAFSLDGFCQRSDGFVLVDAANLQGQAAALAQKTHQAASFKRVAAYGKEVCKTRRQGVVGAPATLCALKRVHKGENET